MKKSKKCDFKKLALLGLATGAVLIGEVEATDLNQLPEMLAFNGCGGSNGCNGGGSVGGRGGSYQAYRNMPYSSYNSSSCSAQSAYNNGQWQSSQPVSHCNSPNHCNGQNSGQYYQPQSSGYQAAPMSQGQYYQGQNYQASQGCGGLSSPQNQGYSQYQGQQNQFDRSQTASRDNGTYTQWETTSSDTDKTTNSQRMEDAQKRNKAASDAERKMNSTPSKY